MNDDDNPQSPLAIALFEERGDRPHPIFALLDSPSAEDGPAENAVPCEKDLNPLERLPDELLTRICENLVQEREWLHNNYNEMYNLCLASRRLNKVATSVLYSRFHARKHSSPQFATNPAVYRVGIAQHNIHVVFSGGYRTQITQLECKSPRVRAFALALARDMSLATLVREFFLVPFARHTVAGLNEPWLEEHRRSRNYNSEMFRLRQRTEDRMSLWSGALSNFRWFWEPKEAWPNEGAPSEEEFQNLTKLGHFICSRKLREAVFNCLHVGCRTAEQVLALSICTGIQTLRVCFNDWAEPEQGVQHDAKQAVGQLCPLDLRFVFKELFGEEHLTVTTSEDPYGKLQQIELYGHSSEPHEKGARFGRVWSVKPAAPLEVAFPLLRLPSLLSVKANGFHCAQGPNSFRSTPHSYLPLIDANSCLRILEICQGDYTGEDIVAIIERCHRLLKIKVAWGTRSSLRPPGSTDLELNGDNLQCALDRHKATLQELHITSLVGIDENLGAPQSICEKLPTTLKRLQLHVKESAITSAHGVLKSIQGYEGYQLEKVKITFDWRCRDPVWRACYHQRTFSRNRTGDVPICAAIRQYDSDLKFVLKFNGENIASTLEEAATEVYEYGLLQVVMRNEQTSVEPYNTELLWSNAYDLHKQRDEKRERAIRQREYKALADLLNSEWLWSGGEGPEFADERPDQANDCQMNVDPDLESAQMMQLDSTDCDDIVVEGTTFRPVWGTVASYVENTLNDGRIIWDPTGY